MTKKLGRQPDDRRIARVELKAQPGATLTPPASADWTIGVPPSALGMLGNDSVGDCVAAGAFHAQQMWEGVAQKVATTFTTQDALTMYSAISGYTPRNPNSDVGATLISGLQYWNKTGLDGYKLAAYAQIDGTNVALLRNCIALFGVVYAGLNVPSSAMTQFDAGQPWSTVARSRIEGGHCVPLIGYDASTFTCVTWSAYQKMTTDFHARYFDEWWVPVDEDWVSSSGLTPSGLDGATANLDFQSLTGSTASPFPTTTPTPVPTPTPTPTPASTDDATLWAAAQAWAQSKGLATADVPPHVHGH
jgi:hypothetical protein